MSGGHHVQAGATENVVVLPTVLLQVRVGLDLSRRVWLSCSDQGKQSVCE